MSGIETNELNFLSGILFMKFEKITGLSFVETQPAIPLPLPILKLEARSTTTLFFENKGSR